MFALKSLFDRGRFALGVPQAPAWGLLLLVCLIASPLRADPKPLGIFEGIHPTTGPAVVDGLLTNEQRVARMNSVWDQEEAVDSNQPHPRWEDRKGTIVAIPTPTTGPAVVDPLLMPTLVSVHLKDVPTREALTQFGKQTGVRLSLYPTNMWRGRNFPSITIDADNQPLMEVVNEIATKAGFALYDGAQWGGSPPADPAKPRVLLGVQSVDRGLGPWEVSGPFSYEVQMISHSMFIGNKQQQGAPIQINIAEQHEPKLVVLARDSALTITEAVDEKGNNLIDPNPAGTPARQKHGLWSELLSGKSRTQLVQAQASWVPLNQPMWIPLVRPDNSGNAIVRFRATNRYLIQTKSESVEADFSKSTDGVEKEINGVKCKVGPLNLMSPQQFSCPVEFHRTTMNDNDWTQFASAVGGLRPAMTDGQGKPIGNLQNQGNNHQGNVVMLNFFWFVQQFGNNQSVAKPTKLVVTVPTETKQIEVPMQFDNLPLP